MKILRVCIHVLAVVAALIILCSWALVQIGLALEGSWLTFWLALVMFPVMCLITFSVTTPKKRK